MLTCNEPSGSKLFDRLTGVIFDCDGVIVDSLGANRLYYNLVLERLGLPLMSPSQEAYVHMHHVNNSIAHIVPPERLEEAEEIRKAIDYRDILPSLRLEDGLVQFLEALRAAGLRMAVNTNRTSTMDLLLEHFGLEGFFDPVVTTLTVANPKPHPEGVRLILDTWGVEAREVAYLGDSALDEATAEASGVRFWAYKNPALKGELLVEDFGTLRACLVAGTAGE